MPGLDQDPTPVRVLEEDLDLGGLLGASEYREAARTAVATVIELEPGGHDLSAELREEAGSLGWLVLSGIVTREVRIENAGFVELVGAGDLLGVTDLRPEGTLVSHSVRLEAHTRARLAFLDAGFARAVAAWPELVAALVDRASRRTRRLSLGAAISNLSRVEARVLSALWLLAERWGRVTTEGVVLQLELSHRALGELVGAQRPTVTKALGELEAQGRITRGSAGEVLLGPAAGGPVGEEAIRSRLDRARELHELQTQRFDRETSALEEEMDRLSAELDHGGQGGEARPGDEEPGTERPG